MSVGALVGVLLLHLQPPSPTASATLDPMAGRHAYAAYLIGGFFALGLIMLVAFLLRRRPRSGHLTHE
jgi:hypothetical protein